KVFGRPCLYCTLEGMTAPTRKPLESPSILMTATPTPPFRTNPSAIARYFFHDCERFLYYSSADPERRRREGIPEAEFDHSPLVAAILDSGYRWEEEVVGRLLKGKVVIGPGTGPLHTRRLPLAQTLRRLER